MAAGDDEQFELLMLANLWQRVRKTCTNSPCAITGNCRKPIFGCQQALNLPAASNPLWWQIARYLAERYHWSPATIHALPVSELMLWLERDDA
jgi:hypothetical protein